MYGVRSFGSVPTCSGGGFSTHRAFSSAQDDDTRGRMVSQAGGIAAFLEDGILVSQPSPLGNAIKLRKSLAAQCLASPFGGSAEGNMCKRTGFLGAKRR